MLFHKYFEDMFATVTAELVGVVRRGERESLLAKRKATESAELGRGYHLLAETEGFDVSDDAPAVQGIDGCRQGRLPAVGNSVADLFEKGAL